MRLAQVLLWSILGIANLVAILSIVSGRKAARPRRYAARTAIALVAVVVAGAGTTLFGLSYAFSSVADVDASMKSARLARGISEAINCAAFAMVAMVLPAIATVWLLFQRGAPPPAPPS